jgi:hypothetical protein
VAEGVAAETRRGYAGDLGHHGAGCSERGLAPIRASAEGLVNYVAHLAAEGKQVDRAPWRPSSRPTASPAQPAPTPRPPAQRSRPYAGGRVRVGPKEGDRSERRRAGPAGCTASTPRR